MKRRKRDVDVEVVAVPSPSRPGTGNYSNIQDTLSSVVLHIENIFVPEKRTRFQFFIENFELEFRSTYGTAIGNFM